MIARLRGQVIEVTEEEIVLDVAGVGYLVRCGAQTLARLPTGPDVVQIHIEHSWSEAQGPRLYGFLTREDRSLFGLLQTIQGVGPKAALAVLDVLPPPELAAAIARDDKAAVARANGVGPKLAARIVQELKGKPLGAGLTISAAAGQPTTAAGAAAPSVAGEATAALMGLGYNETQARRAVDTVISTDSEVDLSTAIRLALRDMGK